LKIIPLLALCLIATALFAKDTKPAQSSAAWDKLADDFLAQIYYRFSPTSATSDGLHEYDGKLEGYSKADIDRTVAALKVFKANVDAVDPKSLDYDRQVDRDLVLGYINSKLLSLEDIRGW
jgi:uncharacterized protein (DUF885 family)